jgi:hypothetical protein
LLPGDVPHEARERDYFFVLGFWAWGCFAGYGALALARARHWPSWTALAIVLVPVAGNWRPSDRSRMPAAASARDFARALLESAPARGVLFTAGDNDSYPLWYAQQVEGLRRDVVPITLPLLPADWYAHEIARRTGWRWNANEAVLGIKWQHEQRAALIARAARAAGRPIAASPAVSARERSLLGSGWTLRGVVYISARPADGQVTPAAIDSAATRRWVARVPAYGAASVTPVDDVTETIMELLRCPRLALPARGPQQVRDSLEVKCNLR